MLAAFSSNNPTLYSIVALLLWMVSAESAKNFSNTFCSKSSSAPKLANPSNKLFLISVNLVITYLIAPASANSYETATWTKAFKNGASLWWIFSILAWALAKADLAEET